jgi:hypothetical protein
MTARGVDYLELWTERNVFRGSADRTLAARLAQKLEFDAGVQGLSLEELEIENGDVEGYVRNIIVYLGGPGAPGD